jgi:hypothetical protein
MTSWKRGLAPLLCLAPCLVWGAYGADAKVDPTLYWNDVKYLASPELKGRATGSPELETRPGLSPTSIASSESSPRTARTTCRAFR